MQDNNRQVFLELLRAGLWEQDVWLSPFSPVDFEKLYQLAEEQSVVGLIAAGLEHLRDMKLIKSQALPFLKKVFSLEERNVEMNGFIGDLVKKLKREGICCILVKGQGVAQCYARPKWRSAGDVDLLFEEVGYQKAKAVLTPTASYIAKEYTDRLHLGMTLNSWSVELHGSMRCNRLGRINTCIDSVQEDTFKNGRVRVWQNGETAVLLPSVDNDIIFVFTHILQHFFEGGIGLRQICDWCRLLWTYQDRFDRDLLKKRLVKARILSEWKVFASLAVSSLGMPSKAMPFYCPSSTFKRKARRLESFIFHTGNFGHNRDMSYLNEKPYLVRKCISLSEGIRLSYLRAKVFPLDSCLFFFRSLFLSTHSALMGE